MSHLQKAGNQSLHEILQKSSATTSVVSRSPLLLARRQFGLLCCTQFKSVNIYRRLVMSQALLGTMWSPPQVPLAGRWDLDPDSGKTGRNKCHCGCVHRAWGTETLLQVVASPHWEIRLLSFFPFFHPPLQPYKHPLFHLDLHTCHPPDLSGPSWLYLPF